MVTHTKKEKGILGEIYFKKEKITHTKTLSHSSTH
jgi:hypothetical protein